MRYFDRYADIAQPRRVGIVLETPTWRANPDWAARQGYSAADLDAANRDAVDLVIDARAALGAAGVPVVDQRLHRPARRRLPARTRS